MRTFSVIVLLFSSFIADAAIDDTLAKKTNVSGILKEVQAQQMCRNVIGRLNPQTSCNENYVLDKSLYYLHIDTLPQVRFWRDIMNLHGDSALVNIANTRNQVTRIHLREWSSKTEAGKKRYTDSIRCVMNLDSNGRVLITAGKKFFYDFDKTSQNFQRGIHCFMENGVDPWYAQAILLIESPNKLQKSNAGAYGSFQLMKDVARQYGLKVNRHVDERANFERSAYAASCLLKKICIPQAYRMLDSLKITHYSEEDLWFKLLVMHIYHAGAYNVQKALFAINPTVGNMDMIYTLWRTQTARFKSASQNYSQLVLAAMLEMDARSNNLIMTNATVINR